MDIDALPAPPVIDEAKQKELDAVQELRAKRHTAPKNSLTSRARAIVAETDKVPPELLSVFQKQDRAGALAELGRFAEAADYDTPQADFFRAVHKAVWDTEDAPACDCPQTFDREGRGYDPRFTLREIFNERTGKNAQLLACNNCSALWVKDI